LVALVGAVTAKRRSAYVPAKACRTSAEVEEIVEIAEIRSGNQGLSDAVPDASMTAISQLGMDCRNPHARRSCGQPSGQSIADSDVVSKSVGYAGQA
jgi:hypothetical protein